LDGIVHLAIFVPPIAGLTCALFELIRLAPKLLALEPAFATKTRATAAADRRAPPASIEEIRFDSVCFAYDGVAVFRNLSFAWQRGHVLGIRGANGSGKSTLLRLVLGLLRPDTGAILVNGIDLAEIDLGAWRRNIGYLPQRPYQPDKF